MGADRMVAAAADGPFIDNDYCFACGSRNPLGLHLSFVIVGEALQTRVAPMPHWQGWANVVHGGLQATIMDDLMSNHLFKLSGVYAVTAELTTRFRRPVPLDQALLFTSHLDGCNGRVWQMRANCATVDAPDVVLSTASGRFMEVPKP